ncbi:MAG: hypothetical protein MI920_00990 [Kiloniellales bacterium]|nr:hypothetical protein [Kiloniellales bacterium]
MRAFAIYAVLLCMLAGCSTRYDSTWRGGVEAKRISESQYLITAKGNYHTEQRVIEEFALLKAAETTVANNKMKFKVVDANVKSFVNYLRKTSRWATVNMTIEMAGENPDDLADGGYFTAKEILDTLGPKHFPKD